jgi:hypothetical protein
MTNIELQRLLAELPPDLPIMIELFGGEYKVAETSMDLNIFHENKNMHPYKQFILIQGKID